jgi:hypothetical protein
MAYCIIEHRETGSPGRKLAITTTILLLQWYLVTPCHDAMQIPKASPILLS